MTDPETSFSPQAIPDETSVAEGLRMGQIRQGKALAASFDGLVRSIKNASGAQAVATQRTYRLWKERPDEAMEFGPTKIIMSGKVVFQAQEFEGRWLLPAFMAGLRSVKPRRDFGEGDIRRLAEEIANLKLTEASLVAFRDWLWSDGAEGFDVDLQTSFVEVGEAALSIEGKPTWNVAAVRSLPMRVIEESTHMVSAMELDAASMREPFQISLDLFGSQAKDRTFELSVDMKRELRDACDDPLAWAEAEIEVVLSHPELRTAVPADRLARRLAASAAAHCDLRLLQFFSSIGRKGDDYSIELVRELDQLPIGDPVARHMSVTGPESALLGECLKRSPPRIAGDLLLGLLDRAGTEPAVLTILLRHAQILGPETFCKRLDANLLQERSARSLTRILSAVKGGMEELGALMDSASNRARAVMLATLPSAALFPMRQRVLDLFQVATEDETEALTHVLVEAKTPDARLVLAEVLRMTRGQKWNVRDLRAALTILVENRCHGDVLVELARSNEASSETRLAVLRALEALPDLLREASAWRLAEMWDPLPVRQRLKAVRKKLKEGA